MVRLSRFALACGLSALVAACGEPREEIVLEDLESEPAAQSPAEEAASASATGAGGRQGLRIVGSSTVYPFSTVVAEQFGTLASLYPERIDLGLGRAPIRSRATPARQSTRAVEQLRQAHPEPLGSIHDDSRKLPARVASGDHRNPRFRRPGPTRAGRRREHGLDDPTTWGSVQDGAGDIWFASNSGGVLRYDGERFHAYDTTDGLPHNKVYALHLASDGTLYAGTFCAGLWRRPPAEGS